MSWLTQSIEEVSRPLSSLTTSLWTSKHNDRNSPIYRLVILLELPMVALVKEKLRIDWTAIKVSYQDSPKTSSLTPSHHVPNALDPPDEHQIKTTDSLYAQQSGSEWTHSRISPIQSTLLSLARSYHGVSMKPMSRVIQHIKNHFLNQNTLWHDSSGHWNIKIERLRTGRGSYDLMSAV